MPIPVCSYVNIPCTCAHGVHAYTHPHLCNAHLYTLMYSHAHTTHRPMYRCTHAQVHTQPSPHTPHPQDTLHTPLHTYPHIHICACVTMSAYTHVHPHHVHILRPVHTHTRALWIPYAHMQTYALHKDIRLVYNPATYILHTHPHKYIPHTHAFTPTWGHIRHMC